MEKFDQPELHPRGFSLAVNILLVGALILLPIFIVALYEVWHSKHEAAVPAPTAGEQPTQAQLQKAPDASAPQLQADQNAAPKTDAEAPASTPEPATAEPAPAH